MMILCTFQSKGGAKMSRGLSQIRKLFEEMLVKASLTVQPLDEEEKANLAREFSLDFVLCEDLQSPMTFDFSYNDARIDGWIYFIDGPFIGVFTVVDVLSGDQRAYLYNARDRVLKPLALSVDGQLEN
jgi:hypothetical protein